MKFWLISGVLPLLLVACAGNPGRGTINDDLSPDASRSGVNVQRLLKMGDQAQEANDVPTALSMYSAANRADPNDAAPVLAGAKLLEATGDTDAAARLYDTLAARRDGGDRLTLQLAAARSYLKGRNYAEAAVRYDKLAGSSGDWRAFNGLGVVRDLEGNQGTAIRAYQTALEKAPDQEKAKVRANLALSHIMDGAPDKAIDLLEPLDRQKELSSNEQRYLALAYGFAGRTADAQRLGLDEVPSYEALKQAMENPDAPAVKAAPAGKVTAVPVDN